MKIKIAKNKKGLTSVFLAVFLVIIIISLTASLFASIEISGTASLQILDQEQEKQQEGIFLKIGSITFSDNIIQKISVTNTGSIPVVISAIYIDKEFLRNPELLIKPLESADIALSDLGISYSENLFNTVMITTERGTKFSTVIKDLEETDPNSIETIYGPIRLLFEEFHWANFQTDFGNQYLRTANWKEGWKVIPGTYAIWRLTIQNIDLRTITLDSKCCLVLRSPSFGQSPPVYYIDSLCSDMTIEPREYSTLYFVWKSNDPTSRTQNAASSIPQSESAACISFLILEGSIGEKLLGQTIPFEAVFISST